MPTTPNLPANFTNTAQRLLAIESIASQPAQLQAALDAYEQLLYKGCTIERFVSGGKPSLLAYNTPQRPTTFTAILNGHVDVVPGTLEQFKPHIKDGRLYGRGAYDMKVAALLLLYAFNQVAPTTSQPIALQLVTDEEVGGTHGTAYQIKRGVRGEIVVVGEKTDLAINNEAKGIVWATFQAQGKAGHSAYQWEAKNANNALIASLQALLDVYPELSQETWRTSVNIAHLFTPNTTPNSVPDYAEAKVDIRYVASDSNFAGKTNADVKAFLDTFCLPGVQANVDMTGAAQFVEPTNHHISRLRSIVSDLTGQSVPLIQKHGTTDARHYAAVDVPAVVFGISGDGIHADNEYADLGSCITYYQTICNFLSGIPANNINDI